MFKKLINSLFNNKNYREDTLPEITEKPITEKKEAILDDTDYIVDNVKNSCVEESTLSSSIDIVTLNERENDKDKVMPEVDVTLNEIAQDNIISRSDDSIKNGDALDEIEETINDDFTSLLSYLKADDNEEATEAVKILDDKDMFDILQNVLGDEEIDNESVMPKLKTEEYNLNYDRNITNQQLPEKEFLYATLFAHGVSRSEIAEYCNVAYDTVKKSLQNVFRKYDEYDISLFKEKFKIENYEKQNYQKQISEFESWRKKTNETFNSNEYIYLKDKSNNMIIATAVYMGGGLENSNDILVFKGSHMNVEISIDKKWLDNPVIAAERNRLIIDGVVKLDESNRYVFVKNQLFVSPDIGTPVLLGYSIENSWQEWENIHGKKLGSIVDKEEKEIFVNKETEKEIIEEFTENLIADNAENLKKYFESKKRKDLTNKYNLIMINRFLEETYESIIIPRINADNREEFILEFDQLLSLLKEKSKQILIDKYGLFDGEKKTFVDVANKFELTVGGAKNSITASIQKIRRSDDLIKLKKFYDFRDSKEKNTEKLKKDIDFIMSLMK